MSNPELPVWVTNTVAYLWSLLLSGKFWVGVLIPIAAIYILRLRRFQSYSVSVGLPFGLGSKTYDTTPTDRIVAWKLYVQLVTRKAALPFDEEHDLIKEVYDSLFTLFEVTRDLLLNLPPREFQREEGVASLMLRVLNDGVRPHLTRWQADFRRWWEAAVVSDENRGKTPQEIQRQYPRYTELIADLRNTNTELSKFADKLREISSGRRRKRLPKKKVIPLPPTPEHPSEVRASL
jgi:hypothetical protein